MTAGFIHLSDIHFGQETTHGAMDYHDDIKQCIIEDVREMAKNFSAGKATGIIVTGDIAYSGLAKEYQSAASWLDEIAQAAGCPNTEIQVVPGNHDVERGIVNEAVKHILEDIIANGQSSLDKYMSDDDIRSLIFKRFRNFIPFAEGYRCPLDQNGRPAEDRLIQLAPGRSIRFVRLNSALVSYKNKEDGNLLLGESQHVIRQTKGEEKILLSHHPLHCFKDQDPALKYINNRARIFISGHEHNPSCSVTQVDESRDLMLIAAGATIPPKGQKADYCFNLIEFDWDEKSDGLSVKIYSRIWNDDKKMFEMRDGKLFDEFKLACPNFRGAEVPQSAIEIVVETGSMETIEIQLPQNDETKVVAIDMEENYPLLILKFFRDISYSQRTEILTKLGSIPPNVKIHLNEAYIRALVDQLVEKDRSEEIWAELKQKLEEQK